MNWTILLALAPVFAKYGPAAIALYQADEPLAMQFISQLQPVFAAPSLATIIPLLTTWGPQLTSLVEKQGVQVQQFIKDIEAAIDSAGGIPTLAAAAAPASSTASVALPDVFSLFTQLQAQIKQLVPAPAAPPKFAS